MKKISLLLSACALLGLYSCESEQSDNPTTESNILIEVDNQTISIDNSEVATFTVYMDGEDVTAESQIVNITDGGYSPLSSTTFTTLRPGTHTFFAIHPEGNSDKIAVVATSESNLSSTYYRRNIVMKFTATWCTYCPLMTSKITAAKKEYPDRLIEIVSHVDDDYATTTSGNYYTWFGISSLGLPAVNIDLDSSRTYSSTATTTSIIASAQSSMEENPTVAGIKLDTSYDSGLLSIDVETAVTADGDYKIIVLLLQSGYEYSGTTYDHVIFTPLTKYDGESLGEMVASERVQRSYEFDYIKEVGAELDTTQTEVVVCILNGIGDARYAVNNALSAGVNESIDYQYEQIITE